MTALIVIVSVIAAILFVRLGIWVLFYDDKPVIKLGVQGFYFELKLGKGEKKPKSAKKKEKPKIAEAHEEEEKKDKPKKDIKGLIEVILNALKRIPKLTKGIHIVKLYADVRLVGGDAAKTAETYGKVSAVMHGVYPFLCKIFTVKNFQVDLAPDFTGEKTRFRGEVKITTCIWNFLVVLVPVGFEFVRYFMKENNKNKNKTKESGGKYERECETAVN